MSRRKRLVIRTDKGMEVFIRDMNILFRVPQLEVLQICEADSKDTEILSKFGPAAMNNGKIWKAKMLVDGAEEVHFLTGQNLPSKAEALYVIWKRYFLAENESNV